MTDVVLVRFVEWCRLAMLVIDSVSRAGVVATLSSRRRVRRIYVHVCLARSRRVMWQGGAHALYMDMGHGCVCCHVRVGQKGGARMAESAEDVLQNATATHGTGASSVTACARRLWRSPGSTVGTHDTSRHTCDSRPHRVPPSPECADQCGASAREPAAALHEPDA